MEALPEDSQQEQSQPDLSDSVEAAPEEVPEAVEAAPEVEAALEEVPEETAPPAPEIPNVSFSDLNDVDSKLESFSPEIKSYVAPILEIAKTAQSDYKIAASRYEAAKEDLVQFADALKDYGVDTAPVMERFQQQQARINELNDSVVHTTWSAFQVMHPEYDREPPKLKKVFSELVSTMLEKFPGESTLDKLNGAYKYAKYTAGAKTVARRAVVVPKAPVPDPPKKEEVSVDSKAQSLVNDGRVSGSQSMVDVADLSWNEILDRHKHLLE